MRSVVLGVLVVLAAYMAFILSERAAAPSFTGAAKSGETPTRHIHGGRTGGYTSANNACRNICEPHCTGRWGSSSWTYLLWKGCFLSCIDVACIAR
jgi:hypothetical protein